MQNEKNFKINQIRTESTEESKGGASGKNKQRLYIKYIDVNSITNTKDGGITKEDENEFSENDLKIISTVSETQDLFALLVKSFCPSIFGNELVKAGILLSIVGGSDIEKININQYKQKQNERKNGGIQYRKDCHCLIIGDPGLGKSQLLQFASQVCPRSVYVTGNATTTAGLTASVSKDASGEGSLEAGAIVLADQGVCCIDEFDKMQNEHLALLEAMEQQSVSIAKSGVLCSLQARCSIIASANPIGGSYNKGKSIKDNIKISNAILSRFDLIFLLLDNPDPKRDQKLSEHIMKLHNCAKRINQNEQNSINALPKISFTQFQQEFNQESNFEPIIQNQDRYQSIQDKLQQKIQKISQNQMLDMYILRKYLNFVKKNINPCLSPEAALIINNFYLQLRENNEQASQIPITTRQLESLIRLSQARAKIECRSLVTEEDAFEIVELMQESLFDALEDLTHFNQKYTKNIKNLANQNVSSLSVPKQTKLFIEKLQEECDSKNDYLFEYQQLMIIAKSLRMNVGDFGEFIEKLNFNNILILKKPKLYELNSKKL